MATVLVVIASIMVVVVGVGLMVVGLIFRDRERPGGETHATIVRGVKQAKTVTFIAGAVLVTAGTCSLCYHLIL